MPDKQKKPGRPPGPGHQKTLERSRRSLELAGFEVLPPESKGIQKSDTDDKHQGKDLQNAGFGFLKSLVPLIQKQAYREKTKDPPKQYVIYDNNDNSLLDDIIYRPINRIPYEDLRDLADASSLVTAILNTKSDDARLHTKPQADPGFRIKQADSSKKSTDSTKKLLREWESFVIRMGVKGEHKGKDLPQHLRYTHSRDRFPAVIEMATRDVLTIGRTVYLPTRNLKKEVVDVVYLDPATIYRVDPNKGYKGDKSIEYVQAIDRTVRETFEYGRLVVRDKYHSSDVRHRFDAKSPLESCVKEIIAILHGLMHNSDKFNQSTPPRALFSSDNRMDSELKDLWEALWDAEYGAPSSEGRLGIMHGIKNLQMHKLDFGDDGMLYEKLMSWTAQFILAAYGMDGAELGLKFDHGQTLSEPSTDGRADRSRNRSHGGLMDFHADTLNEVFALEEQEPPLCLEFIGVKAEDKNSELDRQVKRVGHFATVGQIRAEREEEPWSAEVIAILDDMYKDEKESEEYKEAVKKARLLDGMILNQHAISPYMKLFGMDDQQQQGQEGEQGMLDFGNEEENDFYMPGEE